ncbi:TPA: hypothetical protein J4Z52_001170 [Escherichia coli]|uniref:hypothetical protein n=1 Tax=Escherichia coli TaxID=562 RepID=UPI00312CA1CE|nr:hypothetical protein [Escherichia coli]
MKVVFNIDGKKVPLNSLRYKSKEDQIEVMRNWFFENFEDPANACPYESREGGYHYIYGGPYDASEELQAMFEPYVKSNYIEELVGELQGECYEWSGSSNNIDWYDDDLYDAVISSEKPFDKFLENVEKIKALAKSEHHHKPKEHLLSILYTNVITALETLYVELFINSIERDDSYIADCIEKGKTDFKVSKEITALPFRGESIEKIRAELIKAIKEHLISASWHNTELVVKRYKATFGIKAQNDWPIGEIEMATLTRNHLVHRGGKDKEGKPVVITEQDLEQLLEHAMSLGTKLYDSLHNAIQEKICIEESEF